MLTMSLDDSDLQRGLDRLMRSVDQYSEKALMEMADTLLLLSRAEVPHDEGTLQASGHTFWRSSEKAGCTAYNTPYAAFQHEGGDGKRHLRVWQKGRKKKYLEDPLKNNMSKWLSVFERGMERLLSAKI